MKKLAVILDSFSSQRAEEIEKKEGGFFIPLKIIIDEKNIYKDGVDKSKEEIMKEMNEATSIKTSMPSPADIIDVYKRASEEYEKVLYFPVSGAISSTVRTAMTIAQDFPNVEVIESLMVGKSFEKLQDYLLRSANIDEKPLEEVIQYGRDYAKNIFPIYIITKDISHLIKLGRINKVVGNMISKLNAIPILSYEDFEKVHSKGMKRTITKAISFVLSKFEKLLEEHPGDYYFLLEHTLDTTNIHKAKEMLGKFNVPIVTELTSGLCNAALGDGSFAIGLYKEPK